ncbi:MAG: hypothetical protein Ct9H300mP16_05000 [Pseudomonadota bacterium]|nr:MAG: hypothetical protein Ct9H300mP16_05000 [Pseudomonadota bacterium]
MLGRPDRLTFLVVPKSNPVRGRRAGLLSRGFASAPSGALSPSIGGSVLPKVKSLPDDVEFELAAGETLLEGALKASIPIAHACGGRAKCSTCRFWVLSGLESCPDRNPAEAELSSPSDWVKRSGSPVKFGPKGT